MKQFELKFTEKNLQRHLSYNPYCIHTVRDEMKGNVGDMTIIDSLIYYVYGGYPTTLKQVRHPKNTLWIQEGFSSQKEYVEEIERIYGSDQQKRLYDMVLYMLGDDYSQKRIRNPITGKHYLIRDKSSKPLRSDIKGLWEDKI